MQAITYHFLDIIVDMTLKVYSSQSVLSVDIDLLLLTCKVWNYQLHPVFLFSKQKVRSKHCFQNNINVPEMPDLYQWQGTPHSDLTVWSHSYDSDHKAFLEVVLKMALESRFSRCPLTAMWPGQPTSPELRFPDRSTVITATLKS